MVDKMKRVRVIKSASTLLAVAIIAGAATIFSGFDSQRAEPVEQATLTTAPNVPPRITRDYPAKVVVHLFVKEYVGELMDGVKYQFWSFNGTVPGPMIRVRQGDLVEIHLSNASTNVMPHNIDLHAVIGPGGGAGASMTLPGHTSVFSFTALHSGLFMYHCAMPPVPEHIANGMYGLILVQPKKGLPPVDKEYYVMQSEFYTTGKYGQEGLQQFDLQKAIKEQPTYVVFNGRVGSLIGKNALTAKVGQKVRIYAGNIGPNLISSFHIIGEMFADVYGDGGSTITGHDIQTTLIPAGGAAIVELTAEVPGTYTIVDHSIFRAIYQGALGQLKVTGNQNRTVFSGKEADQAYTGE